MLSEWLFITLFTESAEELISGPADTVHSCEQQEMQPGNQEHGFLESCVALVTSFFTGAFTSEHNFVYIVKKMSRKIGMSTSLI